MRPTDDDYMVAIRDANVRGIMGVFFFELGNLLRDYDMEESVFGVEVTKLMESFYKDMND